MTGFFVFFVLTEWKLDPTGFRLSLLNWYLTLCTWLGRLFFFFFDVFFQILLLVCWHCILTCFFYFDTDYKIEIGRTKSLGTKQGHTWSLHQHKHTSFEVVSTLQSHVLQKNECGWWHHHYCMQVLNVTMIKQSMFAFSECETVMIWPHHYANVFSLIPSDISNHWPLPYLFSWIWKYSERNQFLHVFSTNW